VRRFGRLGVRDAELSASIGRPPFKKVMWEDHTTLFLSGGGLKVAAFVGALEALDAVVFEEVYGLSAGSLVACLLVAGRSVAQIRETFLSTPWSSLFFDACSFGRIFLGKAPVDGDKFRAILSTWLSQCGVPPGATLAWLSRNRTPRFGCFALDLKLGEVVLFEAFKYPDAKLIDVVMASAALPGIMDPVFVAGRSFIDLGITNNAPLSYLRPSPGKKILALVVNTGTLLLKDMMDSPTIVLRLKCSFLTRAEILSADPEKITVLEMPLPPKSVHPFKVSAEDMQSLMRQGRLATFSRILKSEVAGLFVFLAHVVLAKKKGRERARGRMEEESFTARIFSRGWDIAKASLETARSLVG